MGMMERFAAKLLYCSERWHGCGSTVHWNGLSPIQGLLRDNKAEQGTVFWSTMRPDNNKETYNWLIMFKRKFLGRRKRQACFSSLVGVWSSGKRLLSPKETAPDGEEAETDKACRLYLIYSGLFLSYSRETKQRSSVVAHLYCKAVRTWKTCQYGRNCHSCDRGWGAPESLWYCGTSQTQNIASLWYEKSLASGGSHEKRLLSFLI